MSIFGSIVDSIFHHSSQAQAAGTTPQAGTSAAGAGSGTGTSGGEATRATAGNAQAQQAGGAAAQQSGAARAQPAAGAASGGSTSTASQAGGVQRLRDVDVEAVLEKLAATKGGGGNWRTSIVDLLKLLGLDSSLAARKELARELDVHAGADGSAEENMALQKAVMGKLAQNGGKVPDSLRH